MNLRVPFGRPDFSDREIEAVTRVMRSGWVGLGPETASFEKELAAEFGVREVVCVNSCTSALLLSLRLLGVGPGDEVVCPSLTWCSTANAALYLGARPVFCDVDPGSLCVTPETVNAVLTPRTRAVVPVHLGGRAVDIMALRLALPASVAIVEDAAHALGARFPDGRMVGSSGHPTCFSFYANKAVSTADGGAISLDDSADADKLRSLRLHGLNIDAWNRNASAHAAMASTPLEVLGYKANYTDLQAAIGRVQLSRQHEFVPRRAAVARIYTEGLGDLGFAFQESVNEASHARHLFFVILPQSMAKSRPAILVALRELGIGVSVHYPPLHRMPLYAPFGPHAPMNATEDLAARIITLPIGASICDADANWVVAQLRKIVV